MKDCSVVTAYLRIRRRNAGNDRNYRTETYGLRARHGYIENITDRAGYDISQKRIEQKQKGGILVGDSKNQEEMVKEAVEEAKKQASESGEVPAEEEVKSSESEEQEASDGQEQEASNDGKERRILQEKE